MKAKKELKSTLTKVDLKTIAHALAICKETGEYLDLSLAYLLEKGEQGINLLGTVIESARDKTLTFPGMITFGRVIRNKRLT